MAASFVRCAPLQSSASQRWRDTRRNTSLKGSRPTEPLRARVSHSIYGHGRASVAARAEVPDSPGDALSEVAALDNLIDLLTDASEEEVCVLRALFIATSKM